MTVTNQQTLMGGAVCETCPESELKFLLEESLASQSTLTRQCRAIAMTMLSEAGCRPDNPQYDSTVGERICINPALTSALNVLLGGMQFERVLDGHTIRVVEE